MSCKFLDSKQFAKLNKFGKTATRKLVALLTFSAILVGLAHFALAEDFSAKILQFADSKVGETVVSGECGDFVLKALESAGAAAPKVERVWGKEIKNFKELKPGDIIQLCGDNQPACHKLGGGIPTGSFEKGGPGEYWWIRPHTMIVASYKDGVVTWYHQNWAADWFGENPPSENPRTVALQETRAGKPIKVSEFSGSVKYYRPDTPKPATPKPATPNN